MSDNNYPPLPEPQDFCVHADDHQYDTFTADQMRAYVDADRAARAKANSVEFDGIKTGAARAADAPLRVGMHTPLPANTTRPYPHIQRPYTADELRAKIASHHYGAESLLQHAMIEIWRLENALVDADRAARAVDAQPVPAGYKLVIVPDELPGGEPDWEDVRFQAETATGLMVRDHTLNIVMREVRRWLAHRTADAPLPAPPAQPQPSAERDKFEAWDREQYDIDISLYARNGDRYNDRAIWNRWETWQAAIDSATKEAKS